MALEFKSSKTFKFVIGASALFISTIAATFSVTGVASLFSGYFFTVALMMSGLEFGKVVLASFLARYWKKLSLIFKTYFIIALTVLITITSAGIFGYLSDGYQKTKGSYDVNEKEVVFIKQKVEIFTKQKEAIDKRISSLTDSRAGQEKRLDSLYARRQNSTAKSVESYIANSNSQLDNLTKQSATIGDSVSKYSMNQLTKETKNATGELGPLKYLATIFNTDMDTIVKYFIFLLIFVFDPLAVLLFVSLNIIIKNEESEEFQDRVPSDVKGKFKNLFNEMKLFKKKPSVEIEEEPIIETEKIVEPKIIVPTKIEEIEEIIQSNIREQIIDSDEADTKEEIIENVVNAPIIEENVVTSTIEENVVEQPNEDVIEDISKEHEFYHGEKSDSVDGFHTANFSLERIYGKKKDDDDNVKTY